MSFSGEKILKARSFYFRMKVLSRVEWHRMFEIDVCVNNEREQ